MTAALCIITELRKTAGYKIILTLLLFYIQQFKIKGQLCILSAVLQDKQNNNNYLFLYSAANLFPQAALVENSIIVFDTCLRLI